MSHVSGSAEAEDLDQIALEASSHAVMSPGGLLDTKEAFRCFVHVASEQHLCVRVRTLAVYAEINKMVGWVGVIVDGTVVAMVMCLPLQLPRSYQALLSDGADNPSVMGRGRPQVSSDSLLGQGASVAEKSSVKKSVVGKQCVLKDRSKVVGSVLMEGVVIGERWVGSWAVVGGASAVGTHVRACRATVQNCVLSHHVEVGEGATLKECYLGPGYTITQGSGSPSVHTPPHRSVPLICCPSFMQRRPKARHWLPEHSTNTQDHSLCHRMHQSPLTTEYNQ